jgi:hypothetical protein
MCLRSMMAADFKGGVEDGRVRQGRSRGGGMLQAGVKDGGELRGWGRGRRSAQGRKVGAAVSRVIRAQRWRQIGVWKFC